MGLEAGPAVEHVKPKALNPKLALTWANCLLACDRCNSTKGETQPTSACLWPDRDNTFAAFTYGPGGEVSVNPTLAPSLPRSLRARRKPSS